MTEELFREQSASARAGEIMLLCGLWIGQCERRLLTAGKLAAYVGMPRPTTIRKLHALEKRNLVHRVGGDGRYWQVDTDVANSLELLRIVDVMVMEAGSRLSGMDSRNLVITSDARETKMPGDFK